MSSSVRTDPLSILKELISVPSVNPMGRDVAGEEFYEGRLTAWLEAYLTHHGLPCEIVEVAPDARLVPLVVPKIPAAPQ